MCPAMKPLLREAGAGLEAVTDWYWPPPRRPPRRPMPAVEKKGRQPPVLEPEAD